MAILRKIGVVLLILIVLAAVPAVVMAGFCRGETTLSAQTRQRVLDAVPADATGVEVAYKRDEARTYLTFPEWFIVYVAQDYGRVLTAAQPSAFPYFSAVADFWTSYCAVTQVTTSRYPMNWGAHVMIYVIGISHSVEYLLKGVYENTIGRVFEWLAFDNKTQEDAFAAEVAVDYGEFLNEIPWYEYPFFMKLGDMWFETSGWDDGFFRKWERKFFLTGEYGIKGAYGAVLGAATGAAYAPAETKILLVTTAPRPGVLENEPGIEQVAELDDGDVLLQVPRYAEFTRLIARFALAGVTVREIAGNGEILVTALMPSDPDAMPVDSAEELFDMTLAMDTERRRVGYRVAVARLGVLLGEIEARGGSFEHAYDY